MEPIEIFSLIGSPARLFARTLLFFRYLVDGYPTLKSWGRGGGANGYARARFGESYRWRFWLMFDVDEMERLERVINEGGDEDVVLLRDSQLESSRLVAVVGALMSQAAISALSLPSIEHTHWAARMDFTISLVISLLAIFFTCVQHRSLGFIRRPIEIRAWLSNGTRYRNSTSAIVFQSSMVAHQLLHAPYELVGISLTSFIGGLGTYLGSAWVRDIPVTESIVGGMLVQVGNLGVLVCFLVGTVFACAMFGTLVGNKSAEMRDTVVRMEDLLLSRGREIGARVHLEEDEKKT